MTLWENLDHRARRLGIVDTKLAQGGAIFLALAVVKLLPQILELGAGWFAALAIACSIKPSLTFFGGERRITPA